MHPHWTLVRIGSRSLCTADQWSRLLPAGSREVFTDLLTWAKTLRGQLNAVLGSVAFRNTETEN
jgi:hypothetical protein